MFLTEFKSEITNLDIDSKIFQPNAIDLVVHSMFDFQVPKDGTPSRAGIFTDGTKFNEQVELIPRFNEELQKSVYTLQPKTAYSVLFNHHVKIAEHEMGWLISRSSLTRNGLMITSGVYDSGFNGQIGGLLINHNPSIVYIEQNARLAQLLLSTCQMREMYDGQYQSK